MVQGVENHGVAVTEDERTPGADVVDVFVAVGIEDVRSFAALDEGRSAADAAVSAHGGVHAAGNGELGAFEKLLRSCVVHLLRLADRCMNAGHHYNEMSLMITIRGAAIAASLCGVLCGVLCGTLTVTGCRSAASPDVAATVNGRPIYYAEVDKAYKTQFPDRVEGENEDQVQLRRLEILRQLIDNELMLQRAEKAGLVATDADVDARLNEMKAPYTKEEFDKQLKTWGLYARGAQGPPAAR